MIQILSEPGFRLWAVCVVTVWTWHGITCLRNRKEKH